VCNLDVARRVAMLSLRCGSKLVGASPLCGRVP
jgi:hypothetical protein